ncbi:MAG: glycosyltransferase family 39 protein, partial [Phycisphaerae bacterium]|nr:glycosyltransferase family 39 protein [Phycisphaerae bacterium]
MAVDKRDFIYIAILIIIALVIGVYLITTTVMIAKDGVSYINYAKALSSNPLDTIRDCSDCAPDEYTPGYPFLILLTHKAINLFGNYQSASSWIYSAQSITLLCRLFALIPLYLIGKLIAGNKLSFLAMLIFVILPYPAKMGSDVLRDWPHILFLATGFLFLIIAAKYEKWLIFGLAGFIAGLGYMIRPMCAQLLAYGVVWLIANILKRKHQYGVAKTKLVCGLVLLLIGFTIVAAPYSMIKGEILPAHLQRIIENFSSVYNRQNTETNGVNYTAAIVPILFIEAFGKFTEEICANLMYFFAPFMAVGLYYQFRRNALGPPIKFFITAFILLNFAMVILRYVYIGPDLSRRYILPLITIIIFFVPIGLQISAQWIDKLLRTTICKNNNPENKSRQWFFILLAIGISICLPKLLRPLRIERKDYRQAAKWIKENTQDNSLLAITGLDPRITFYAERIFFKVPQKTMPSNADFAVKMYDKDIEPEYRDGIFYGNGKDSFIDIKTNPIPSSGDFTISGWVYCEGNIGND